MSKVSNWWYLVPILFALVGGVIAYFGIRSRDKDKANNMIILGAVVTAVQVILNTGFLLIVSTMLPTGGGLF